MKPHRLSQSTVKELLENMPGEELSFAIVYNKKGEPKLFMAEPKETTETLVAPEEFTAQVTTQVTAFTSQSKKTCILINGKWVCW